MISEIYLIFLLIMNILAFSLYGDDKKRAEHNKWRIKESTLLLIGFMGGGIGALIGMKFFRHKTRKNYFWAVNIFGICILVLISAFLLFKT